MSSNNYIQADFLAILISSIVSAFAVEYLPVSGKSMSIMVSIFCGILAGMFVRQLLKWQRPRSL